MKEASLSRGRQVVTYEGGVFSEREDRLSAEEPLEIRVNGEAVSITMRTPGHDAELAAGFLHGEGLLPGFSAIQRIGPALEAPGKGILPIVEKLPQENVVEVWTDAPLDPEKLKRHFYATSACGVCGKSSLKALATLAEPVVSDLRVTPEFLVSLPEQLRSAQATFERTGSLHATALFEATGRLLHVYEDVGRHNAVDKAIGRCLLDDCLPLDQVVMLVSGRTSFEILQKAVMARIPVVAAISGPSTLAVELAEEFGVTLVGFLRGGRFNVYSHPERIASSTRPPSKGNQTRSV
jgi:FdhD protein